MRLTLYKPANLPATLLEMDRSLERMLENFFSTPVWPNEASLPSDLIEQPDHYVLHINLPGVGKDGLTLQHQQNRLLVSGQRKEQLSDNQQGRYLWQETHSRYARSFELPADANLAEAHAEYTDGVLTVIIPKREESKPKLIPIR